MSLAGLRTWAGLAVLAGLAGPAQAQLMAGPARELSGARVVEVSASLPVLPGEGGGGGVLAFPVPIPHRGQLPLAFALRAEPAEALRRWRWVRREDGLNWLCEAELEPPASGATLSWQAVVWLPVAKKLDLMWAQVPEMPELSQDWIRSTACVQALDWKIRSRSLAIDQNTRGLTTFVEHCAVFAAGLPAGSSPGGLDAVRCAESGGPPAAKANLLAALLRAGGLPARILVCFPESVHPARVEYWHPSSGWIEVDPERGVVQPEGGICVVLSVAGAEDEDRAFDEDLAAAGHPPGLAAFSTPVYSGLTPGPQPATHALKRLSRLEGAPAQLEDLARDARGFHLARRAEWQAGRARPGVLGALEAAFRRGDPGGLREFLRR